MYEVYPHPTTRSKGGAQARAGVVKRRHTTASCFSLFVAAVAAALLPCCSLDSSPQQQVLFGSPSFTSPFCVRSCFFTSGARTRAEHFI